MPFSALKGFVDAFTAEHLRASSQGSQTDDILALLRLTTTAYYDAERMDPQNYPYLHNEIANVAMRYGCEHDRPELIRLAHSHKASINLIEADKAVNERTKQAEKSTLALAVEHGALNAFKTLIELGARLDALYWEGYTIPESQIQQLLKGLVNRVRSPVGADFFRHFLEAGQLEQVQGLCKSFHPLLYFIRQQAPIDVIRAVLDRGADPNMVHFSHRSVLSMHRCYWSPLSMAIVTGQDCISELLIERGADPRGRHKGIPVREPTHLPLYAAIYRLAKDCVNPAPRDWVGACLALGADINQPVQVVESRQGVDLEYTMSPLYYFLGFSPDPSGLVKYPLGKLELLMNAGALVQGLERLPFASWELNSSTTQYSCLEVLINQWGGPRKLAIDANFRAAVKLLIDHGAARNETAYILQLSTETWDPLTDQRRLGLSVLTSYLILDVPQSRYKASKVLWLYIGHLYGASYKPCPASEHAVDIIRALILQGADVNAFFTAPGVDPDPMPILHAICQHFAAKMLAADPAAWDAPSPEPRNLGRILIQEGANPYFRVRGRTAFDILVDASRAAKYEWPKELLWDLCYVLKGHDTNPVLVRHKWKFYLHAEARILQAEEIGRWKAKVKPPGRKRKRSVSSS